jgi:hypothetical protein
LLLRSCRRPISTRPRVSARSPPHRCMTGTTSFGMGRLVVGGRDAASTSQVLHVTGSNRVSATPRLYREREARSVVVDFSMLSLIHGVGMRVANSGGCHSKRGVVMRMKFEQGSYRHSMGGAWSALVSCR